MTQCKDCTYYRTHAFGGCCDIQLPSWLVMAISRNNRESNYDVSPNDGCDLGKEKQNATD